MCLLAIFVEFPAFARSGNLLVRFGDFPLHLFGVFKWNFDVFPVFYVVLCLGFSVVCFGSWLMFI
jgi:hypothetical protein